MNKILLASCCENYLRGVKKAIKKSCCFRGKLYLKY